MERDARTSPTSSDPRGIRRSRALVVAFNCGFAVMAAEIAAGRLLAPYYGTSTTIWAVLIAGVLGSLALGNVLGGRLSRRGEPRQRIIVATLLAALLLAVVPHVGRWLLAGSVDRMKDGHVLMLGLSLSAVVVLLTLPVVLIGMATPLLLHAVGHTRAAAALSADLGIITGELNASSTVGSLIGALGSGLLFIPWVGTTRTLCLSSAVLVLNALVLRGAKASSAWSGAIVVGCVCWSALIGVRDVTAAGGRVLWQTESRYQHITVLEKSAERQLRINEGFALQSFVYLDGRLPIRSVWAYYALAPSFIREPMPHRALLLGLGGGTTVQIYRRLFPSMELTGVELDPQMLEAGQSALGVDFGGVRLVTDDARVFVSREAHQRQHSYDVIVLDAFQFPYIPFQLSTREFFRDLDALLASGGVVMLNVGRHGDHHEVVDAVARTLNDVFPHVLCADVVNQSNSILVASRHAFADAMGRRAYGPGALRLVEGASIASGPLHAATWPHGTPVLTDDLAPVESLTDQIVWHTLFDAAMREPGAG